MSNLLISQDNIAHLFFFKKESLTSKSVNKTKFISFFIFLGMESKYSCCSGDSLSDACSQATTHVSQNFNPKELKGYVRTLPKEPNKNGSFGVYALGNIIKIHHYDTQ